MKPIQVKATIERGDNGTYDVTMEYLPQIPFGLLGQGNNVEEAIALLLQYDMHSSMNVAHRSTYYFNADFSTPYTIQL